MSATTWFSYFVGIWASVYLVDAALRAHPFTRQWYAAVSARLGISFDILQARFFTARLNDPFQFICRFDLIPWKLWFSCGVLFSVVLMVFSFVFLTLLAYNTLTQKSVKGGTLTPVMPGVNLPMSHLGFYLLTLLLCAVLHEAGHALAALRERVRLHGFGLFLFGVYPGAFVDLNTADLQTISPSGQLRIYCAGVWHNAVVALVSLLLFYAMPTLLSPAYSTGRAVGITYLRENSVVTGQRGLTLGDAITHVNSCPVTNQSDWYHCLEQAHRTPSGYCVSGLYVSSMDSAPGLRSRAAAAANGGVPRRHLNALLPKSNKSSGDNLSAVGTTLVDCCAHQFTSTHLCFTYNSPSHRNGHRSPNFACLPARPVTERTPCFSSSDCLPSSPPTHLRFPRHLSALVPNANMTAPDAPAASSSLSTRGMVCVIPSPPDNQTRLVRLAHNRKDAPAVLFLGPLDDLLASIGVSDYVARWPKLLPPQLPTLLGLFCTYLFSLSGALVIFNAVPCYALDGQWILKALIDWGLTGGHLVAPRHVRSLLYRVILAIGTGLLAINVLLAFRLLFRANWTNSVA